MPRSHFHAKAHSVRVTQDNFCAIESRKWLYCGCYGVYLALMGSTWMLQGLHGSYRVYILLFFEKIAVRGSYGIDLREGVTAALYRVSQKKRNGGLSVPCELKVLYYFTPLDKASSAEENDTKIIKFGWVIFILYSFLEMQSFSNFPWFLRLMSEELCRKKPSIRRSKKTNMF